MSSESALLVIAKALWKAKATTSEKSQQYLANALGYPRSWQVVRRIDKTKVIVDRIYAGSPSDGVDMYFNHSAAQAAAVKWVEGESGPFDNKGGQLLARKPKFQKGDRVQVNFKGEWFAATIQKRTERKDGYRYTVFYPQDNTTQSSVQENLIQLMDDPVKVAAQMGFVDGGEWQAKLIGKKWKFIAPDGKNFTSKTAAMKHFKKHLKGDTGTGAGGSTEAGKKRKSHKEKTRTGNNAGSGQSLDLTEGDPPWRSTGHVYLGRRVQITSEHKKSATRVVQIVQHGSIVGWIADTDVDTNGEPGFISEKTNKPANLFHCLLDDEPGHPYFNLLVERKDMEEYEVEESLLPLEKEDSNKKRKTS